MLLCLLIAARSAAASLYTVGGLLVRDGAALQAEVTASIASGASALLVQEGAYYFDNGAPLLIRDARNWTLRPASPRARVELWFRMTSNWSTGGVLIRDCADVTVDGVRVDYDPPPYYQGTIDDPGRGANGLARVRTDPGFPDAHAYVAAHGQPGAQSNGADPSVNYVDSAAIWARATGFACNRTLGCPGHGAATLQPLAPGDPPGMATFAVLASARAGDKITLAARKGLTYHVQNSSRVTTRGVSIHSASLMGISEFDGRGEHVYESVFLGRRPEAAANASALCGRAPGRLCLGVLSSNADAFHSSGTRRGPALRNATLSSNGDDTLNVHSRMQLVSERISDTVLVLVDPRLAVAAGCPDDHPYGAAETMPNAKPGDVLDFHALNTFAPLGSAVISSTERLDGATDVATAARVADDLDGRAPWHATPALTGSCRPDVGQLCSATAARYGLPPCASRVWRVTLRTPAPPNASHLSLVSLRDWDASGAAVEDCAFFGGIDGIRWKSSGGRIVRSAMAVTYLEVTPLQQYLEGPPTLANVTVANNTYYACGGHYGTAPPVQCGAGIPVWNGAGGFCRGAGGKGAEVPGTCSGMSVSGNAPATSCCFADAARASTCCSVCGPACKCC